MTFLVYATILVLPLGTLVWLRAERVREDGWEFVPWYTCVAVFAFAASWPLWVALILLTPRRWYPFGR